MRDNKFHYYDGKIYQKVIDPVLKKVRKIIIGRIEHGSKVIDIGCGTGALAFELAKQCSLITGLELSSKMANHAGKRKREEDFKNIEFIHSDAACLPGIEDKKYDYAVMSMMIHEMPMKYRSGVLNEAIRVSKSLIIADYSAPLPLNLHGIFTRIAEFLAGFEHFSNFRSYQKSRGIYGLLEQRGLSVIFDSKAGSGVFKVLLLRDKNS